MFGHSKTSTANYFESMVSNGMNAMCGIDFSQPFRLKQMTARSPGRWPGLRTPSPSG